MMMMMMMMKALARVQPAGWHMEVGEQQVPVCSNSSFIWTILQERSTFIV
jgi:hypothetical protein